MYKFKEDSADGRLLVWKVIADTRHDNLLSGNGTGYVEANYGKWQADYFMSGKGSESERYVADYVTCSYNEFIETGLEQGIIAILLFTLVFYLALKQKITSLFALGAKASLIALIVVMFASYPLKVSSIYLYLVFCLAVIFNPSQKDCLMKIKTFRLKPNLIYLLFIPFAFAGIYDLSGYYQLKKGQELVFSGQIDEGLKRYAEAEPIIGNNGLFQFYYGSALALQKRYDESNGKLEMSIQKSSIPNSYILSGNNYKELREFENAKQAYLIAVNMVPSKLYQKYLLANLLMENSDYEEAGKWAREILATKEKIPTTAAKEIKRKMEEFISSGKVK